MEEDDEELEVGKANCPACGRLVELQWREDKECLMCEECHGKIKSGDF